MGQDTQLVGGTPMTAAFALIWIWTVAAAPPPLPMTPTDVLKDRVDRGDLLALKEIAALQPDEAIRTLRAYARRGVWSGSHPEPPGVHDEAIRLIVQIPGHAEYSAKVIEASRSLPPDTYDTRRRNEFRMLSTYRSEEAMEVLGRYLSDPTPESEPLPKDAKELKDWHPRSSNAMLAALQLRMINPPDSPPKQTGRVDFQVEVELFKKWWAERQAKKHSASSSAPLPPALSVPPPKAPVKPQPKNEDVPASVSSLFRWAAWLVIVLAAIGLVIVMLRIRR